MIKERCAIVNTIQPVTVDSLLSELTAHPVNSNIFFIDFRERVLTTTQLQMFIRHYHFFCHRFVKLLEGLLYCTPLEELEMRVELTKTLYSELGSGSSKHAHIRQLERFAQAAEVSQHDLRQTQPLPEIQEYLDTVQHLFMEAGYLQALGAEWAIETTAVSEFHYFLPGLQKYSIFTSQDLTFFSMHLEEEMAHSDWITQGVRHTAKNAKDLEQVAFGARQTAEAWHTFWKGMHRAVFDSCA
ncbi:iron-containing redox enzyme family protein [Candidatus Nitrospira salsa]